MEGLQLMNAISVRLGGVWEDGGTLRELSGESDWRNAGLRIGIESCDKEQAGDEHWCVLHVRVDNVGTGDVTLPDVFIDIDAEAVGGQAERDFEPGVAPEYEDYYLWLPGNRGSDRLLMAPVGETQFAMCETLADRRTIRCYLFAANRRAATQRHPWVNPARPLHLEPGEGQEWAVLYGAARTDVQVAETLVGRGRTPLSFHSGVNGMRAIAHHFADGHPSLRVNRQLVNDVYCATITDGRLSSLTATAGSVEAIDPDCAFGDFAIELADGNTLSTADESAYSGDDGSVCVDGHGARLSMGFSALPEALRYEATVENAGQTPLTITDLRMPFMLNSSMAWGTDTSQRMIRHSQVAGDNSFIVGVPCDGTPPYLVCTPHDGTSWELFDDKGLDGGHERVYTIHCQGLAPAERAERVPGGRWRLPVTSLVLAPGERRSYVFDFQWASGYEDARRRLMDAGKVDVRGLPGLTVPRDQDALVLLRGRYRNMTVSAEYPDDTAIRVERDEEDPSVPGARRMLVRVHMNRLGENRLRIGYGDGRVGWLECFATLPIGQVVDARARYIKDCQARDSDVWYDGLLRDRNTLTGEMLDPDHHGEMPWRTRYAIASDDPGLSRPAFLSSKNAERPDLDEIDALNRYCDRFVWGGLQRTDAEEYPYAVYGVPDWHDCRGRQNLNANELLHVWRLYDYPHVALLWFNMYRIASAHPDAVSLPAKEYLRRAYGTFLAMYQYPAEIEQSYGWSGTRSSTWNPYRTGFYNELVIADVIAALREEHMAVAARRLEFQWGRKADFFIREAKDLFGSEYAFDTTGFESTQALVDWGRTHAAAVWNSDDRSLITYTPADVERFDLRQRASNIACRGSLENAYYLTGSDIRGDSAHYTLSYMSQMGGWSLLRDALYADGDPFELLRLAYTSLLSSWAVVNAGDKASGYGYWYPGADNNGASSGGFEPLPNAETWLGQPAYRGVWRFGSETDLGFCGYLRGASCVLADDPDFGQVAYGGSVVPLRGGDGDAVEIIPSDGVNRRLHVLRDALHRLHVLVEGATIVSAVVTRLDGEPGSGERLDLRLSRDGNGSARVRVSSHRDGYELSCGDECGTELDLDISSDEVTIVARSVDHL